MQETVTNSNDRKSLFSSFLDVLEAKEQHAQAERELQEEKYLRRTQRIYEFHERQRREAVELRRCLDYVSTHALVLEGALRGSGGQAAVPLSAALARQAAGLASAMAACVTNANDIRQRLAAAQRPHMDALLAKMESELSVWRAFIERAVDATCSSETTIDNLHNLIAEQRRYVREVSNSEVFAALTTPPLDPLSPPRAPALPGRAVAGACSTPIEGDSVESMS